MIYTSKYEKELIKRLNSNDEGAFEILFKAYYSKLCIYAISYVKLHDLAEDIVQETYTKIWNIRNSLEIKSSFKSYIFKSVHNNCINFINQNNLIKRKKEIATEEILYQNELMQLGNKEEIIDQLIAKELEIEINKAINNLPKHCNEIFQLSRDSNSYTQIAKKLNISVNTVKTQIKRALKRLRDVVDKQAK